jgi:Flp pilus assembly protein TadG
MIEKRQIQKKKFMRNQAQAIVEFAIVLPILLALVIGIFEVGRLMFIFSAVTNSSRTAVRYASAVGFSDSGYTKFNYCYGIRNVAYTSAYLVPTSNLAIAIAYDGGPGTTQKAVCDLFNVAQTDPDVTSTVVSSGDRVTVTITAQYTPMLKLIPIPARTITSKSSRTILGIVNLEN